MNLEEIHWLYCISVLRSGKWEAGLYCISLISRRRHFWWRASNLVFRPLSDKGPSSCQHLLLNGTPIYTCIVRSGKTMTFVYSYYRVLGWVFLYLTRCEPSLPPGREVSALLLGYYRRFVAIWSNCNISCNNLYKFALIKVTIVRTWAF